MPSRIAWSSALRLAGLEIVRRRTPSPGRSLRTSPLMAGNLVTGLVRLLEDDQRVALVHRLALLAEDLLDRAGVLGLDRHLHLHRLEDDHGVALVDLLADLALDLPDGARDVGHDLRHDVLLVGCARSVPGVVDGAAEGRESRTAAVVRRVRWRRERRARRAASAA